MLPRTPFSLALIFGYHLGLFLTQAVQRFRIASFVSHFAGALQQSRTDNVLKSKLLDLWPTIAVTLHDSLLTEQFVQLVSSQEHSR